MNYQESFTKLLNEYGLETINNTFLVCSYVSDYIKGSIIDLELLNAYCLLNENEVLLGVINNLTLKEAKQHIKARIVKADKKYTILQYIKSMEPLLLYLYPQEYKLVDEANINKTIISPKVVRVHRGKEGSVTSFSTLQNHNSPLPSNNPAKAKKANKAYTNVSLQCECRKLFLTYGKNNKLEIIDGRGNDCRKKAKVTYSKDKVNISINDPHKYLFIYFPKMIYDSVDINYIGKKLSVIGDYLKKFVSKDIVLNMEDGEIYLSAAADNIKVNNHNGKLSLNVEAKDIKINSNKCNTNVSVEPNDIKSININNVAGNIDIYFNGASIQSTISTMFNKVRSVNNIYNINGKKIKVNVNTLNGKISVI